MTHTDADTLLQSYDDDDDDGGDGGDYGSRSL